MNQLILLGLYVISGRVTCSPDYSPFSASINQAPESLLSTLMRKGMALEEAYVSLEVSSVALTRVSSSRIVHLCQSARFPEQIVTLYSQYSPLAGDVVIGWALRPLRKKEPLFAWMPKVLPSDGPFRAKQGVVVIGGKSKFGVIINLGVLNGIHRGMLLRLTRDGQQVAIIKAEDVWPTDTDCSLVENTRGIRPEDRVEVLISTHEAIPSNRFQSSNSIFDDLRVWD